MKKLIFLIFISTFFIQSCGYKIGSMTVGGIKTLSIAPITNETNQSFIDESIVLNKLSQHFTRDGSIKVTGKDIAEAILHVRLTKYIQSAQAYSESDIGTHFRLILTAEINLKNNTTGDIMYSGSVEGEALYEVTIDQSEIERLTLNQAIDDLCLEVVRNLIEGGW